MSRGRPGSPIVANEFDPDPSSSDTEECSMSLSTTELMSLPPTPPPSPSYVTTIDDNEGITTIKHTKTPLDGNIIQEYSADDDFEEVLMPQSPPKSRPLAWLTFFPEKTTNIKAFHKVEYTEHNGKPSYLKHNEVGSIMSELEAVNWGHYELIAPEMIPASTRAHYNPDGEYVAVSSKAIPGFKSTLEDPLTKADLNNNEVVKGLAIGLTCSYLFQEDDLHRGNMSKDGKRVDFDMSLWTIIGEYKTSSFVDYIFRLCKEADYAHTERDIKQFPDIVDAKPFYWPTKPQPIIPETIRTTFAGLFSMSQNAFPSQENELYKSLVDHPTFVFYKFQTMLKYILTTPEMYRAIIQQHLREDHLHNNGVPLIEFLVKHRENRIDSLRELLKKLPAFQAFMYDQGKEAFENIKTSFEQRNQRLDEKMNKVASSNPAKAAQLATLKIDIKALEQQYQAIARFCQRRALLIPSQGSSGRRALIQTM